MSSAPEPELSGGAGEPAPPAAPPRASGTGEPGAAPAPQAADPGARPAADRTAAAVAAAPAATPAARIVALDLPRREEAGDDAVACGRALLEHLPGLIPGLGFRFYGWVAPLASLSPLDRLEPIRTDRELLDRTLCEPPALHHAIGPLPSVARVAALRAAPVAMLTLLDLDDALRPAPDEPRDAIRRAVLLRAAGAFASRVVVPTELAAARAASELGIARERISVVAPGVAVETDAAAPAAALDWIRARHALDAPFLLWAATPDEVRNIAQLVQGLLAVAERLPGTLLVFSDRQSRRAQPSFLAQELRRIGLGARIRLLDAMPPREWRLLVQAARAVVVPDPGRAFPYLALEAMALGAPVAAHDSPLHREVLADGARLFDPARPAALVEALVGLDAPASAALAASARARAASFRWERSARLTAELYLELLDGPAAVRDLAIPPELAAVAPAELVDLEPLLAPHRRAASRRVLLALAPAPAEVTDARLADPDEIAGWHVLVALASVRSGPEVSYVPGDAALVPLAGSLEPLATVVGAARVEPLERWLHPEGGSGRVLPLPQAPELLTSHPPRPGLVAFRLAERSLPAFPGELRSVWLGRRMNPATLPFERPTAELAVSALEATEGAARGLVTLLLVDPEAVSAELLAGIGERLRHSASRYRIVLPLGPAQALERSQQLHEAARSWLAGVVLDDGARAPEAAAALRRDGLRVCLRARIGGADPRALAAEVLRIRAVGADDVLPRFGAPGAVPRALAEAVASECRRHLGAEAVVELERELLEARAELGLARTPLGRSDRSDDGHRACRAELREVAESHRRAIELLEAYVGRLERSLVRALSANREQP